MSARDEATVTKFRLLVVDDEPINLTVMRTVLVAEGHEVLALDSGLAALKHVRAGDVAFDMVLLDVHMPALNGLETALCLRQIPEMEHVPILFVSARASQADRDAGMAAGGQYYLTKPFKRKDLLAAIDAVVRAADAPPEEIA
jgi:CheY-like chemotaxis protein